MDEYKGMYLITGNSNTELSIRKVTFWRSFWGGWFWGYSSATVGFIAGSIIAHVL